MRPVESGSLRLWPGMLIPGTETTDSPPNILLVVADNLGWTDFGSEMPELLQKLQAASDMLQ